jgi:ATP-dependent DNA helicase RecQ
LHRGEHHLLYVAPERLMLPSFLERCKQWQIAQIAIDEAHCISEWGHDFRPEYRQLAELRTHFPGVPIMALTATATERVRRDILEQLKLRKPACYVASFNRPNLTYRVVPKSEAYQQILTIVRSRPDDSGIIYCASRAAADRIATKLTSDGIAARPYHAGLAPAERAKNQELFRRDDIRVVAATIAFGMGVNKPNVRFVLHHDLPKNIEGYYQETGRAGRDGLPAECVLLFNAGDVMKQKRFIDEKNEEEQATAREQLRMMVAYAETGQCRRATVLRYFGEEFPEPNCAGCDNCLTPREMFDGTIEAQKLLSCVHRVEAKHGFGFGLNHVVEVLTGGETEAIRQRGHDSLSTYGIGREVSRAAWLAMGRELVQLGLLEIASGKFSTVHLTPAGRAALRERTPIRLTKPVEVAPARRKKQRGEIECDEILFQKLKALRRTLADARNVPAYLIFSDATLREMARSQPTTEDQFRVIPGVGERKHKDFAKPFTGAIAEHVQTSNGESTP